MRLLSSADPHVRFNSCNEPIALAGGYAVLSHVWQDIEQSYAEIAALEQEFAPVSDPRLSVKVRKCCRLAQAHGLPWFWVDAPCIDQTNSAELSEAISSMYEWYAQASVCFAHLPDVPSGDHVRAPGSAFRKSVYFRRAWTLQELIAPRRVVFLSADWTVIGDKHELADLLEEITGIDQDVLTFRRPLSDVSVADRLSWALHRNARRPEDIAYCLMGLFGIHMAPLYGEGAYKPGSSRSGFRGANLGAEHALRKLPHRSHLYACATLSLNNTPLHLPRYISSFLASSITKRQCRLRRPSSYGRGSFSRLLAASPSSRAVRSRGYPASRVFPGSRGSGATAHAAITALRDPTRVRRSERLVLPPPNRLLFSSCTVFATSSRPQYSTHVPHALYIYDRYFLLNRALCHYRDTRQHTALLRLAYLPPATVSSISRWAPAISLSSRRSLPALRLLLMDLCIDQVHILLLYTSVAIHCSRSRPALSFRSVRSCIKLTRKSKASASYHVVEHKSQWTPIHAT